MRTIEGTQTAAGFRFAIVVSKYNDFVTDRLQAGALAALAAAGVGRDDVTVVRGAGRVRDSDGGAARRRKRPLRRGRLPRLRDSRRDAALRVHRVGGGARLTAASAATGVPMTFGVLTTNSVEEALERAGEGPSNKGCEAAAAAVEMASVVAQLARQPSAAS